MDTFIAGRKHPDAYILKFMKMHKSNNHDGFEYIYLISSFYYVAQIILCYSIALSNTKVLSR